MDNIFYVDLAHESSAQPSAVLFVFASLERLSKQIRYWCIAIRYCVAWLVPTKHQHKTATKLARKDIRLHYERVKKERRKIRET